MGLVVDPKEYIVGAADIFYRPLAGGAWVSVGATMEDGIARITQSWYSPDLNGILGPIQEMDNLVSQIAEMEFTMAEIAGAKLGLSIAGAVVTPGSTADDTVTPQATTLAAAVAVGDTAVKVVAITGFLAGDYIRVNVTGGLAEYRRIDVVGTLGAGGTGLQFRDPLTKVHASGVAVVRTLGNGKTDVTGTGVRRQPAAAYNQWAMVTQSPLGYHEFTFDSGISNTDSAEVTFGDEATGAIRATIQARYKGATPTLAPLAHPDPNRRMIERSEEERAAAAPLIVTIGGAQRELPILTIRELKSWKGRAYADADIPDDATMGDLMDLAGDRELDLIAAYDVGDELGGRDALEDLTPEAAHELFGRIMAVAFPLVDDVRTVMAAAAMGALQAQGEVWEWALAHWAGVRIDELTPEQLELFWAKGQERLSRDAAARASDLETAVYHAVASVWDPKYGKRRLADRRRRPAGRPTGPPTVHLDEWMRLAADFPEITQVGGERLVN